MAAEWGECLGEADAWLLKPLQRRLRYAGPLPVQQAVVPSVQRALMGGFPMDVCLTAPTGSGKTLCYLLPMLRLVAECKKGVDHTRLRALVLVPTKALGTQVHRELQQLTCGTSIAVESLCRGEIGVKEEAEAIVRSATVVNGMPVAADLEKVQTDDNLTDESGANGLAQHLSHLCYYSRVDILIATPQRLLRHLDGTAGFSLADLRFLVIDEADQVLAGNFANFVAKVIERFEEEQMAQLGDAGGRRRLVQRTYGLHKMLCSATLSSHIARISEVRLRNCCQFALDSFGSDIHREDEGDPLLLPSDKQTKAKKRRRARDGEDDQEEEEDPAAALPISRQQLVRTSFALPPSLQEHVVFVEDWYRHAVLLKLVRAILARQSGNKPLKEKATVEEEEGKEGEGMLIGGNQESKNNGNGGEASGQNNNDNKTNNNNKDNNDDDDGDEDDDDDAEFRALGNRRRQRRGGCVSQQSASLSSDYPSSGDDVGKRILVFCRTAEEARVMGHFLLSAGVQATEFTTLATESERRRALLKSSPDACIVASDALMRGVDVPNVGHVIMYNPPQTLSQYVHRAGRTARAMRAGHLHLLLQKNGPSGTQSDGEVAVFKALSAAIARTQPVRYERHFFMFDRPQTAATRTSDMSDGASKEKNTTDKTRLLINEANEYLKRTQARLSTHWASALESNKKGDVVSTKEAPVGDGAPSQRPTAKKVRKS